ncbi:MAG: LysM peptidoglycan-binding domain-containing protein [candidate division NC10 bacterium]|nr:LysM peptidoglycan-binding domain-containing protein [candidate division NC10 bacterium]MBI2162663.1 LysM peptidoglycan-binding domain-containing protein [candidate division NC10 bacterium]MBI3086558.1 LysM peptidoglycan-binding domain-containing protein [candidate division NC10 bacterium]
MRRPRFLVPGVAMLVALSLTACGPRVSQRVEDARVALEAARAAGAPMRAAEGFQAAERALKESETLLAAGDSASLLEADYRAAVATAAAYSAVVTAKLSTDVEKAAASAQAARQEAERARAETERLQAQLRTVEETARATQARGERVENQMAEIRKQVAASSIPILPTYLRYVVKRGDTLQRIAARPDIYGDANQWPRLYETNRDMIGRDRKLKVGQVLLVPK